MLGKVEIPVCHVTCSERQARAINGYLSGWDSVKMAKEMEISVKKADEVIRWCKLKKIGEGV